MTDEWRQFDSADMEPLEEETRPMRKRLMPNTQSAQEPVAEYCEVLGEIIHRKIMKVAETEGRTPRLDERMEYQGYHGCLSVCRVRVFDPPRGEQGEKRPVVVLFTELPDNPGTSVTNRIEHLATLLYARLGKPEAIPVFVEHYPDRGVHYEKLNRWQFPETFSFVGFCRSDGGRFQTPRWQHTTRMTIEVIAGQPIGE